MQRLFFIFFFCCMGMLHTFGQTREAKLNAYGCSAPFFHGVASGDPLPSAVILWTRVSPMPGAPPDSIATHWEMATDTSFSAILKQGDTLAVAANDYTVKVDATGLQAGSWYYYRFSTAQGTSPMGRTRTAPSGPVNRARFGVVSCSNFEYGYFNGYADLANRNDVDAVLHLGDYIYEYQTGGYSANLPGRNQLPPNEIVTLTDYRTRYSHYRLDADLQAVHQQYPFICIWDDHETANNSWMHGAENHQPTTEGPWATRESNAVRAWYEWLPVRKLPFSDSLHIYRSYDWGNLLTIQMLESRLEARDEQLAASDSNLNNANRELLGAPQMAWLVNGMKTTPYKWHIIGNQVMMAPLEAFGNPLNTDQWDGYPAERRRLYDSIVANNIQNVVVLTGDIHSAWANDLPDSNYVAATGAGSLGVEFICTSITSPGPNVPGGVAVIQTLNPHCKYVNVVGHGYMVLDVDTNRAQSDWYFSQTLNQPNSNTTFAKAMFVNKGERFVRTATAASPQTTGPVAPPACVTIPQSVSHFPAVSIVGAYPNPASDVLVVQVRNKQAAKTIWVIRDISGRMVCRFAALAMPAGLQYANLPIGKLSSGTYILEAEGTGTAIKFVKN